MTGWSAEVAEPLSTWTDPSVEVAKGCVTDDRVSAEVAEHLVHVDRPSVEVAEGCVTGGTVACGVTSSLDRASQGNSRTGLRKTGFNDRLCSVASHVRVFEQKSADRLYGYILKPAEQQAHRERGPRQVAHGRFPAQTAFRSAGGGYRAASLAGGSAARRRRERSPGQLGVDRESTRGPGLRTASSCQGVGQPWWLMRPRRELERGML